MKDYRIAVFDTGAGDRAAAAKAVRECFQFAFMDADALVTEFSDADALVSAASRGSFDMAIVGVNGFPDMEVARRIRDCAPQCFIVLASDSLEYGAEGVRLRALDYMLKPVTLAGVREAVKRGEALCPSGKSEEG